MGSLPERQNFVVNRAKPQDRFQDRALTPLMAGRGWIAKRLPASWPKLMDSHATRWQREVVRTRRLIVEPLLAHHADELIDLLDERVNRYFSPRDVPLSQAALREQFAEMERAANSRDDSHRFHPFVVRTAESQACIGRLEVLVRGKDAEIAFVFVPNAWGKGYAREAAKAIIDRFGQAGVQRFWACVTRGNTPSLALCERLGFALAEVPQDLELWTYDDGDILLTFENAGNS